MLLPPFTPRLNLHTIQQSRFQNFVSYIHANEGAMCRIEFVRLDSPPYFEYFRRWQRDYVWYRPLK